MVGIEAEVGLQGAGAHPVGDGFRVGNRERGKTRADGRRVGESCAAEGQGHSSYRRARKLLPEQAVDGRANQRQQGNPPQMQVRRHSLSRFTWSTFRVSRVRYTAMMMASPTAASAAATTITKKTKIWPLNACQCAANATNDKFTPLSISSMDMKMVMMLRLIRKPVTPQANSMPLKTR